MSISSLGAAHLAAALAALALGMLVVVVRKGTALHRSLGMAYAVSMFGVNATALTLYRLTGSIGPFHVLALISLAAVGFGVAAAVLRWPGWLRTHYQAMSYSYVGLLAAATAEALIRVPALHVNSISRGISVGLVTTLVFVIAGRLILRRLQSAVLGSLSAD
jgi:uncharacterized membrane protein